MNVGHRGGGAALWPRASGHGIEAWQLFLDASAEPSSLEYAALDCSHVSQPERETRLWVWPILTYRL
jgi:hypothetical protein